LPNKRKTLRFSIKRPDAEKVGPNDNLTM